MPIPLSAPVLLLGFRGYYFTSSNLISTDYQSISFLWYSFGSKTPVLVHILTFISSKSSLQRYTFSLKVTRKNSDFYCLISVCQEHPSALESDDKKDSAYRDGARNNPSEIMEQKAIRFIRTLTSSE